MKHPVLRGHPLHAMVSDFPVALIPLALLAAAIGPAKTADRAARLALAGGLGALVLGWWDWLTIPRSHPAWRPATLHGLINTSVIGMVGSAVVFRDRRPLLLGLATGGLAVAAWIGGELVYAIGWRVRPAEELEIIEEEAGDEIGVYREAARRKVDEHERANTFLPPP